MKEEIKEPLKRIKIKEIKKAPQNYWMIIAIVLGAILTMFIITTVMTGGTITGKAIKETEAGDLVLEFAESRGVQAELVEVDDLGSLYAVVLSISGEEVPIYLTKDGEYMVQGVYPLVIDETATQPQEQAQQQPQPPAQIYTEEDLEKLKEFNNCLEEKGVVIYGANWCGWTKKWVETLGGFDTISPIYVECTDPENEETCSKDVASGFPTTKINGESYNGARTVEAIAEATGCPAPELTGTTATASGEEEAQCG